MYDDVYDPDDIQQNDCPHRGSAFAYDCPFYGHGVCFGDPCEGPSEALAPPQKGV